LPFATLWQKFSVSAQPLLGLTEHSPHVNRVLVPGKLQIPHSSLLLLSATEQIPLIPGPWMAQYSDAGPYVKPTQALPRRVHSALQSDSLATRAHFELIKSWLPLLPRQFPEDPISFTTNVYLTSAATALTASKRKAARG
jgi:hypothetical protein